MSCERCEDGRYFDWEYGEIEGFVFCPMCADPLTEQKPLTLDELEALCKSEPNKDYAPLWIKTLKDNKVTCQLSGELMHEDWRYKPYKRWAQINRAVLLVSNYGETWLAYTHKPKED